MSDKPEEQGSQNPEEDNAVPGKPSEAPPVVDSAPAPNKAAKRGSSFIAWMALVLSLVIVGLVVWYGPKLQQRENALEQRLLALETDDGAGVTQAVKLEQEVTRRLESGLGKIDKSVTEMSAQRAQQLERLARIEAVQAEYREEIARFGEADRNDWLLAEAEYLLRLANQRLVMTDDVVSATALLASTDAILLKMDDTTLYPARAAIATDLAALRAVPRLDVEGLYLSLAALINQVDSLVIFQLPEMAPTEEVPVPDEWQHRLQRGFEQGLHKLSDYVVIRRRDVPYEALMDPQWERLVRQNLRMLLEQAQVALLSRNQVLFVESLERAEHWVSEFYASDEAAVQALSSEIRRLSSTTIEVDIPDVSRSVHALDEAMSARLALGKGE